MRLCVKNLSVQYDHAPVLKGVNFGVHEGEFVVVVGKSGSGKTTLLHAIAGFIPFQGEIQKPDVIGMVFQKNAVFPWMTVSQNIEFAIKNHRRNKEEREQIVEEHLKLAQLEDKRDRYPAELSGGQVQRIAFARTLAHNPDLILMDEPFGALDAHTREQMQSWLLDVWSTHRKTVVFVTHSIEETIFLADRVLVLSGGTLTNEFCIPFARPRLEEVKFVPKFSLLKKDIHALLK